MDIVHPKPGSRSNLITKIVSLGTSSNGTSSERDHHDVPYPPPDAFLLPQQPRFEAGEDDTEDEDDDDDDAQSIKSYGSDHIRQSVSNKKVSSNHYSRVT